MEEDLAEIKLNELEGDVREGRGWRGEGGGRN